MSVLDCHIRQMCGKANLDGYQWKNQLGQIQYQNNRETIILNATRICITLSDALYCNHGIFHALNKNIGIS
jgi:hypothetical protein